MTTCKNTLDLKFVDAMNCVCDSVACQPDFVLDSIERVEMGCIMRVGRSIAFDVEGHSLNRLNSSSSQDERVRYGF